MSSKKNTDIVFEEGSGNVFADLGLEDSEELFLRAQIGFYVFKILEDRMFKQREIAELLGIAEGTSKSNLLDARAVLQKAVNKSLQSVKQNLKNYE